jgi:hypothetical protein
MVRRMGRRVFLTAIFAVFGLAAAAADEQPEYIGTATMLPDGTVHLDLRRAGGLWVDGAKDYKPDDPNYAEVLQHIGGLKPGETKLVRPWPDRPTDKK